MHTDTLCVNAQRIGLGRGGEGVSDVEQRTGEVTKREGECEREREGARMKEGEMREVTEGHTRILTSMWKNTHAHIEEDTPEC